MIDFPDLLLTQDLLIRPARVGDDLPGSADRLKPVKVIEVRSSGRVAGFIGETGHGPWLELIPSQRGRGRGSEALCAWLGAMLNGREDIRIRGDDEVSRGLLRKFAFAPAGTHWHSTEQTARRLQDMEAAHHRRYRQRVHMVLLELDIPGDFSAVTGLPIVDEARQLRSIGTDIFDREQYLALPAARAWQAMRSEAAAAGIDLQVVSAFRGFYYQARLIRRKMEAGESIDRILRVSAPPGFSQHHSGRALDLTTQECKPLEDEFEQSDAFGWLARAAGRHGFELSYPRDNPHGIAYEPWHWYWGGASRDSS